ncbi:hypothetical protein H5T51_05060 [Candidatus Bathyarchaeota archaeon]|nr:hypothetical protein [Candidatus Bathyarchaeota archaeon]
MSNCKSKELYLDGEGLARLAVNSKMSKDQLRKIYQMVKVKPLIVPISLQKIVAYIQRQMIRVPGRVAFKRILELIDKYENDRKSLEEVIGFAIYLYEYFSAYEILQVIESAIPLINDLIRRYGGTLYDVRPKHIKGSFVEVEVIVSRKPRDDWRLSSEIERVLINTSRDQGLNLKWKVKLRM